METHISAFIIAVGDYLKNPPFTSENVDNTLDQLLESSTLDLTNENSTLFSYYFHSLYWLLQSFTVYNDTAKKCVEILIKLCNKDNIRKRLIKNIFFNPLCSFLSDTISKEDKYKLLKLIDQLSVDIKLMFLPENIHKTLDILSMWVVNQNELISVISLQILANICYKNDNVKFTLCNSIHLKSLYKYCLNEMDNSIHANKLLIIFKSNEHQLPPSILKLLTYEIIFDCVQTGNVRALRDKIDIFFDIRSLVEDGFKSLNSEEFDLEDRFIKYLENAPRDTVTGAQLAAETLRFLRLLASHNIPALQTPTVSVRLANVALVWCSIGNAELIYNMDCAQIESILLLLAIVGNLNKTKEDGKKVFKELIKNWPVLKELVLSVVKSSGNNENTALHLALVRLMRACMNKEALREHVVKIYEAFDLSYIFNVSASQQNSSKSLVNMKDAFFDVNDLCKSIEQRLLIIHTAALFVDICQYDNKCHNTVKQMLTHAPILNVLSQVLLSKNDDEGSEIKATVLWIIQSGYMPLTEFSKVLMGTPVIDSKIEPIKQIHYPQVNTTLSTSAALRSRLEDVTTKLEAMLHTGKLDEYTEEIILLYSLRISQAETSEILIKENLSAQSKTLALLEQRIEHYSVDRDKMTRLTIMREKSLKIGKREIIDLKDKIDKQEKKIKSAEGQSIVINSKFNDALYQIEQLRKCLNDGEKEKENLKRKHDEEILKYQHKIKKQEKETAKLSKEIENVHENAENMKQANEEVQNSLQQCEEDLNKKNQVCAQRLKELIEIQKEKEALASKIAALQTNLESINKILHGK